MTKIYAGLIVFNGNYVLQECLQSLYKNVDGILISEGPVQWWQDRGYTTSTDGTNEILNNFLDPQNKIKIIHGQWQEKEQQCQAYMRFLPDDADYICNVDCDEIYKDENWHKLREIMDTKKYTEIQFRFKTFFGGFDHYISGYEENVRTVRIQRSYPGCQWQTHRPPRLFPKRGINAPSKVLSHLETDAMGIRIYHYSFCFANQVLQKMQYYENFVNKSNCIPNYFYDIWLPWVLSNNIKERARIENKWRGVQDCKRRSDAFTEPFTGEHPQIIQDNMDKLKEKFNEQLEYYRKNK